jgi:CrcB protein
MRFFDVLYVGAGGGLGAILRYVVSFACQGVGATLNFPLGTLAVNVCGCFLMGWLQGAALRKGLSQESLLFLGAGILGGFTTFSAFGADWLRLMHAHRQGAALAYVIVTLLLCGLFVWGGSLIGGRGPLVR